MIRRSIPFDLLLFVPFILLRPLVLFPPHASYYSIHFQGHSTASGSLPYSPFFLLENTPFLRYKRVVRTIENRHLTCSPKPPAFATSLEKHSLKTPVEKYSLDSARSTPLRTTRSSPGFHGFTLRRSIPFAKSLPSPRVSYEEVFPSYVSRHISSTVNHSSAKSWFLGCLFRIRQTFCFTLRGSFELSLSLRTWFSSRFDKARLLVYSRSSYRAPFLSLNTSTYTTGNSRIYTDATLSKIGAGGLFTSLPEMGSLLRYLDRLGPSF